MSSVTSLILITLLIAFVDSHPVIKNDEYQVIELNTYSKPYDKSIDLLSDVNEKFDKMKADVIENQTKIFNTARDSIQEYKNYRDYDLNIHLDRINDLKEDFNRNKENIEAEKSKLVDSIVEIKRNANIGNSGILDDERGTEQKYRKTIEELKSRKLALESWKSEDCQDCDATLNNYSIDVEIAKIDQEIQKTESKFLKKAKENEERMKNLSIEDLTELNMKYSQLVSVYEKELEELKKKDEIDEENDEIIELYKKYANSFEGVYVYIQNQIEKITDKGIAFNKIATELDTKTESPSNMYLDLALNDDYSNYYSGHQWIEMNEEASEIPPNAVVGGEDIDGAALYVIRAKSGNYYLYGKYAFSNERKNAYVTTIVTEFGVLNFEILTMKDYFWCDFDPFKSIDTEFPICRASFGDSIIPGRLIDDGSCRIGFGYKVLTFTENFEVFSREKCVEN